MNHSSLLRRSAFTLIALLVLAMLVVPYLVGMSAEAEFRNAEQQAVANSPYVVTLKPVYFHRGWFSSDARSEYLIMTGSQPSYLYMNHHINQFVIPFYRWAQVRHEITHLEVTGQAVAIPVDLTLTTDKLFFGGVATRLAAPLISMQSSDGTQFSVKGLNFQARINNDGSHQLELAIPSASIVSGMRMPAFNLTNLTLNSLSSGTQTVAATWVQNGALHIDKIDAANGPTTLFALVNLSMQGELKDHGQNIDVIYHSTVEKSQFGPADELGARDINLDFSYLNLNKAALLSLQASLRDMNAQAQALAQTPASDANSLDPAMQQARFKQSAQELLHKSGTLIANSPAFKIDRLSMKTQFGDIHGSGEVHVNGDNFHAEEVNIDNLTDVLKSRLSGSGSIDVARDIVLHQSGTGQAAEMQHKMTVNMLNAYIGQGYVTDDGKTLTIRGDFGPNGVDINGKHLM